MKTKPKSNTAARELLTLAQAAAKTAKTWIELHNTIYGIGGPFSQRFPTLAQRSAFAKTDEHKAIQKLLESLPLESTEQFSGKLLVRLPKIIHAALAREAEQEAVSLNQLIVTKLSVQLREVVRA